MPISTFLLYSIAMLGSLFLIPPHVHRLLSEEECQMGTSGKKWFHEGDGCVGLNFSHVGIAFFSAD